MLCSCGCNFIHKAKIIGTEQMQSILDRIMVKLVIIRVIYGQQPLPRLRICTAHIKTSLLLLHCYDRGNTTPIAEPLHGVLKAHHAKTDLVQFKPFPHWQCEYSSLLQKPCSPRESNTDASQVRQR